MEFECCKNQQIAAMDHETFRGKRRYTRVNRVCLKCLTHWAGREGKIRKYSPSCWTANLKAATVTDTRLNRLLEIEHCAKRYFEEISNPESNDFEKWEAWLQRLVIEKPQDIVSNTE